MLPDRSSRNEFWCPVTETSSNVAQKRVNDVMTPSEWASLSRLALGEWLPDQQIAKLTELGLAEIAFGQTLLTRLGRSTLGLGEGM